MFKLESDDANEQYGGPFALVDTNANTMILSPAGDFMVAMLGGDQKRGISSGLNRTLASVPKGYTHQTILAIDHGINHTWDAWGHALTDLHNKPRPANDADVGLKYLGYWTDNGAAYYYNYDRDKGYEGTLLALHQYFQQHQISIHYLQLDSWFYPKSFTSVQPGTSDKPRSKDARIPAGTWNRYGGLLEYVAHPDLFPQGLSGFHEKLGLPLITHNRWIDPQSPYHADYKISGIAAVDPKWWNKIIGDIAAAGVMTYEQDWNNYIYNDSPELSSTTWAGDAYMDGMANACAKFGVSMQYCMVLPRNLMQGGAKYPNLTTVRVSGDRLERGKWREFIYGSEMASALGVWPWTDVFRSNETGNMLVCALSGGMVGLADKMGEENTENIFRAVRKDGVIVKPDVPLTPVDSTFIAEAQGHTPVIVCKTYALAQGRVSRMSFAFEQKRKNSNDAMPFKLDPKELGITSPVFAYDFFASNGKLIQKDETISKQLGDDQMSYEILAPVGPSGMAFIGDTGKFITRGKQRIAAIEEDANHLQTTILAAPGENEITLALYSSKKPEIKVAGGFSCDNVSYNADTQIARARIAPDPDAPLTIINGDRVHEIKVTFRIPE